MNKLFTQVSLEEKAVAAATPLDMVEVVAMEDAQNDVVIAAESVRADIQMIESAQEVSVILQDQIAVEERALEAGNVTAGVAAMAAASLQANAKLLGMDPATVAISNESIEQSPTTALKVSLEAAKDTFKKVIDHIKAFVSKVWSKLKKLGAKILLTVTNYEKKFEKLQEETGKLGKDLKEGAKDKFDEGISKKLAHKFYRNMVLNSGSINVASLATVPSDRAAELGSTIIGAIGTDKTAADIKKGKSSIKATMTNLDKQYDGVPSSILSDDSSIILFSRYDGITVKGMTITHETVETKSSGNIDKLTCNYISGSAKKDVLKKHSKDVSVLSISDIEAVIAAGLTLAKAKDDVVKTTDNIISDTEKATNGLKVDAKGDSKDADEKKIEGVYGSMMTAVNTNVLKFSSDALLGYAATLSNIAYLAQINMKQYKSADSE